MGTHMIYLHKNFIHTVPNAN